MSIQHIKCTSWIFIMDIYFEVSIKLLSSRISILCRMCNELSQLSSERNWGLFKVILIVQEKSDDPTCQLKDCIKLNVIIVNNKRWVYVVWRCLAPPPDSWSPELLSILHRVDRYLNKRISLRKLCRVCATEHKITLFCTKLF